LRGPLWSRDGAGAAAARSALGDDFGVELTSALDDFRFPSDADDLLCLAGELRDREPALYTMAELDASVLIRPDARYVMHVRDGTVVTITNLKIYRDIPGVSAASVKRPESADRALLCYELLDASSAEPSGRCQFTPLTSIWALAAARRAFGASVRYEGAAKRNRRPTPTRNAA